jgi:TolA-binding protein
VRVRLAPLGALAALALLASSCAYYNTFYLARKYYDVAALRQPYLVDRPQNVDNQNFTKSIDYSKKVLGQYSKSKWVDDAYLLWARALLGKDDPGQVVNMLQDFEVRYPNSPVRNEAKFYLGVAFRQNRKYKDAARTLDEFLAQAPHHSLAPYAYLERARALSSLQDYAGAATAASQLIDRWPKSPLNVQARIVHAEVSFKNLDYTGARDDFHTLGIEASTDEDRLTFLLREADCLEAAKSYAEEMALLEYALSHEAPPLARPEPLPASGSGTNPPNPVAGSSAPQPGQVNDRYGRIMVRIGTVHVLEDRVNEAVDAYHGVVRDYPHTPVAAEAQFRIGYAYETAGDDFEKARAEYSRVREIATSAFVTQAAQRLANLDRIAKYHSTTKDTVEARAETGFLLAEQYLFQINKPERALEQYRKLEQDFAGTPWGAKAIVAQAWVLSRKLDRKAEADSLFWIAVREHPATDAQLAARDYLEMEGAEVPADLIQLPVRQLAQVDTMPALTPVPEAATALGIPSSPALDSLGPKPAPVAIGHRAPPLPPTDPNSVGPPVPGAPPPVVVPPPVANLPPASGPPASQPPAANLPPASAPPASQPPAVAADGNPAPAGPPVVAAPVGGAAVPAGSDSARVVSADTTSVPAGPRKP